MKVHRLLLIALAMSSIVYADAPRVPWNKIDEGMRDIYSNFLALSAAPFKTGTYIERAIEHCFKPKRLSRCEVAPYFLYSRLPTTFDKRITVLGFDKINKHHEVLVRIALEDLSSLLQDPKLTNVIYGKENDLIE